MVWHVLIGALNWSVITTAFFVAPVRRPRVLYFIVKNTSKYSSTISVARAINANSTVGVSLWKAI